MTPGPVDLIRSHTERLAQEELEREKRRSQQLAEQSSDLNPPGLRIRVWEQMHGLRMPSDPEHPILDVIALGTRLTLSEVQHEQSLRVGRSTQEPQK